MNLDPSDSEGVYDDDSISSESKISASQSLADHAKMTGIILLGNGKVKPAIFHSSQLASPALDRWHVSFPAG